MSDAENPRLEYEGLVEIESAEGCYGVVYLDDDGRSLAEAISSLVGKEPEDGFFPERYMRARITVEVLEPELPDPYVKRDDVVAFDPPEPPA